MIITHSLPRPGITSTALKARPSIPADNAPAESMQDQVTFSGSKNDLAWVGISAAFGGLGYLGSLAHGIPYVGPAISGIAGAVVGASAGAAAAAALPGEHVKVGALAGLVGGAILGANTGGTTATNIGMAVAGATVPFGALIAVFS